MSVLSINFNNVIAYSKRFCTLKSRSKCATFVKKAFEAGGCKYISGNGWYNQQWCKDNGFQLIGDFVPIDQNPRPHGSLPIQFPEGYKQQAGDVCLIKHGIYGHICYAMSDNINDKILINEPVKPFTYPIIMQIAITATITRSTIIVIFLPPIN